MQEFLDFISSKIVEGTFLSASVTDSDLNEYTVDYWEHEIAINELGEEVQIQAGKQKVFTL